MPTTLKLLPLFKRTASTRCSFCRTNRSVKYEGVVMKAEGFMKIAPTKVLVCNRCALLHINDFLENNGATPNNF